MPIHRLTFVGFLMVVVGAVLPFLMVLGILPSTFTLSFVAYFSSVLGLALGLIGAASIAQELKRRHDLDR